MSALIGFPCPYCGEAMVLAVNNESSRHQIIMLGKVPCSACGSRAGVEIQIKRCGRGKQWKEREAAREAEKRAITIAAQARREELQRDPDCKCSVADHARGYTGGRYYERYDHSSDCPARMARETQP